MGNLHLVCRFCDSTNIKTYNKIGSYVISYCNKCHLLSTTQNSAATANTVNKQWYSSDYVSGYIRRAYYLKKRFSRKITEIESIKRGGNLLDLGCGVGLFLESVSEMARSSWNLYGVDINKKLIKEAKTRLGRNVPNLYTGRLTSLKLEQNFFDCITCFDLLEHDNLLDLTLSEIKKILKPSGLLLIQSPNQRSVMAYLCGSLWDWWAVPDHIFHFNPQSLSSILKKQGFHIRKLYTWDSREEFISNIQGLINLRLGTNNLFVKLISKCLYIPLLVLWVSLIIIEKKFNVGSLLVILAEA